MHNCFQAADILLPQRVSLQKWACVACDQYSSQPEYWDGVSDFVGDAPSTLHMIVPEARLAEAELETCIPSICSTMQQYLNEGLFRTYRRSFVYLERTMQNGKKRQGLVGQIDLEDYDFHVGASARIRATEATVEERIPPRMHLCEQAPLEFPHVLMLCDDLQDAIMAAASAARGDLIYDFDLMQDGGHITGWVISGLGVSIVNAAVSAYISEVTARNGDSMAFAVGDGNHSLAAAKACWEKRKISLTESERLTHPSRYALVELENVQDPAIEFEPIHRILRGDVKSLPEVLHRAASESGHPVTVVTADGEETISLPDEDPLAVAVLQPLLDQFQKESGCEMDYIHGADVVRKLAAGPDTVGLILPGMEKSALFHGVLLDGVLPRKTFSMGSASEKRYYLEGKKRQ